MLVSHRPGNVWHVTTGEDPQFIAQAISTLITEGKKYRLGFGLGY